MRDHDDSPAFIGFGKQARLDGRHRYRFTGGDRVEHRLCLFLRSRAGQRWADVLPDLDQRLRACGLARTHVQELRRRLVGMLTYLHGARVSGGILKVEDGILSFVPINRKQRRLVSFPVAEPRTEPQRIR